MILRALMPLLVLSCAAAAPDPFTDLATPFERAALATTGQPEFERVAAIRRALVLAGVYPDGAATDRRIAKALADFPAEQARFDLAIRAFPGALSRALLRFRTVFPDFKPPVPIYLYHSLGIRDGGSAYLEPGHRLVMLFGADMIARLHADDSLEPFLDHELFHLEHQHAFPDCDQFWCVLWQEGLAVDAAASMNPGATDHQLLLDIPAPIRRPTDRRWATALCFVAAHFDDTDGAVTAEALQGGGHPPANLPERFGYYVGYRIAQATGQSIDQLDHLDHFAARKLMHTTLLRLMGDVAANCLPHSMGPALSQ